MWAAFYAVDGISRLKLELKFSPVELEQFGPRGRLSVLGHDQDHLVIAFDPRFGVQIQRKTSRTTGAVYGLVRITLRCRPDLLAPAGNMRQLPVTGELQPDGLLRVELPAERPPVIKRRDGQEVSDLEPVGEPVEVARAANGHGNGHDATLGQAFDSLCWHLGEVQKLLDRFDGLHVDVADKPSTGRGRFRVLADRF